MENRKSSRQGFGAVLVAFLAGNVLGAALALLAAPRRGSETRRAISGANRGMASAGRKVYGTGRGAALKTSQTARRAGGAGARLWGLLPGQGMRRRCQPQQEAAGPEGHRQQEAGRRAA